tara:strand:- start:1169 stop:1384 length:216 start_codon:yes stop_codon:yes gene_type:complete
VIQHLLSLPGDGHIVAEVTELVTAFHPVFLSRIPYQHDAAWHFGPDPGIGIKPMPSDVQRILAAYQLAETR